MVPTPRQGRAADAGLNNKADVRNESYCPVNEFKEILRGFVELNANGYAREGERREALKHVSDCLCPMPRKSSRQRDSKKLSSFVMHRFLLHILGAPDFSAD